MSALVIKYKFHFLMVFFGIFQLFWLDSLLQLQYQTLIYPDCLSYLESAHKLFLNHTGHAYRPIVMAFITGLPYLFGGSETTVLEWSFSTNVLCWLGTALLLFEILKTFLNPKLSFFLALFSLTFFGTMLFLFHVLTESLYILIMMLSFFFLQKYSKKENFLWLSLALSLVLLSMLVKPGSKFLAIVLVVFYCKEIFKNYKSKAMFFLFGSVAIIFIQVVGMKFQFGDYTLSYIDGVTYHNYLFRKSECLKEQKLYDPHFNPRAEHLFLLGYKEQKEVAFNDAMQQIKTNFPNVLRAYFLNLIDNATTGNVCIDNLKNYSKNSNFENRKQFFYKITKAQNSIMTFFAFLLGFYFLLKRDKLYQSISIFILYIILLSGISGDQGDRFHLVTYSFVIILGAKFLSEKNKLKPFFAPPQK